MANRESKMAKGLRREELEAICCQACEGLEPSERCDWLAYNERCEVPPQMADKILTLIRERVKELRGSPYSDYLANKAYNEALHEVLILLKEEGG